MDVDQKQEFKRRFSAFDDEWLIENALRPLTDEAIEATRELLDERGLSGDGLQLRISAVKKEIITRSGVTNQCDFCDDSIAFGAVRSGSQRFCSKRCRDESALLAKSVDLAPDLIFEHAIHIKRGKCPVCGIAGGNVEMRPTNHVIGAFFITHYSRKAELRCMACARKASLRAAASCLFLGWWSLHGLIATPVSIFRNLRVAFSGKLRDEPSAALLVRARIELARQIPDFSDL